MFKFSNPLKISIVFLILHIFVLFILFSFSAMPWVQGRSVRMISDSMENGEDDSIDKYDRFIIDDIKGREDVTSYVEGTISDHRKAGSFGDVIVYRPNGDKDRTPIPHRAVVYIDFNSTTYDPETRDGGGFDIPSLGFTNVMSRFTIKDYEWPKRPTSMDETIDVRSILNRFKALGETPHSGFLTKGDDNDHVDQVSSFGGVEPTWIEPVKEEWIIGVFKSEVQKDPATVSCCFVLMISPLTLIVTIVLFVRDLRSGKREESERDIHYYGGPPNRRGQRPARRDVPPSRDRSRHPPDRDRRMRRY